MAARKKPETKAPQQSAGKPKLARVILEIPEARKRTLKSKAAMEGLTIKDYILRLLAQAGI
jgi:hypothetical protein